MALQGTYFLVDIGGKIHVGSRYTDWNEPRYIVNYFPTKIDTHSLCDIFEVKADKLRESIGIIQAMPGRYTIVSLDGIRTDYLLRFSAAVPVDLIEGGRTRAVKTEFEPVPVPKVRKGTKLEWRDGRWHTCTPKGSWKTIEV